MAAKDAARLYLARQYGLQLYPADVEISSDARGRPRVRGAWSSTLPSLPAVAVAHSGIIGAAIAGGSGEDDLLGLEIERIRPRDPAFLEQSFSAREREWLAGLDDEALWEWATRLWCAKQAVFKALDPTLEDAANGLSVEEIDVDSGQLQLRLGEDLSRRAPELAHQRLYVSTAREGELAVASTACEPVSDSATGSGGSSTSSAVRA
jgi:phosphopantetheinyl transferase